MKAAIASQAPVGDDGGGDEHREIVAAAGGAQADSGQHRTAVEQHGYAAAG